MRNRPKTEENHALINAIAPVGIKNEKNHFEIGENYAKAYGIIKYLSDPDYGWMAKLTGIPGTIFGYTFRKIESADFIAALNKNIGRQRGLEMDGSSPLARQRAKKAADDGEKLMLQIDQHSEAVGLLSSIVVALATDKEMLNQVSRKAASSCMIAKCKPRLLSYLQLNGWKQVSPMYTTEKQVAQITEKIVPLSAIMGGFANASSGYNDGEGYYIAKDAAGNLIIINLWKRGDDRTNSNITILGEPGQGKSTAIKSIVTSEYMMGTKIIFVDPEREYRELCHNLNGDWINAAGGSRGRINPLEIQPMPRDDEDDEQKLFQDEGHGMSDMALYIQHLDTFFSIHIPSLSDMEKAILKDVLIELYNSFHITWDTDITKLKPTDYPIFTDLYELLCKKAADFEKKRKDSDRNYYDNLARLIKDDAVGSLSGLWNGYTTIQADKRCICLDTKDLQDLSDDAKRAQYFIINSWLWKIMSQDRKEKVLAVWDEAYLAIDPKIPQTLGYLRNVSKRDRKYEAALAIISHGIIDFLDDSVKMYGQALLDNASYKIFFGTDGENLDDMKRVFKLTDAEEELLAKKRRKHALMIVGSQKMHVEFDIPEYKFRYFGKAGGR